MLKIVSAFGIIILVFLYRYALFPPFLTKKQTIKSSPSDTKKIEVYSLCLRRILYPSFKKHVR